MDFRCNPIEGISVTFEEALNSENITANGDESAKLDCT